MKLDHFTRKERPWRIYGLSLTCVVVGICEALLLFDVVVEMFYIDISASWIDHGNIEMVTIVALGLAFVTIVKYLRDLLRENRIFKATIKAASGQLVSIIYDKFDDWELTESEQEVAFMLIKGFSVQEIGKFRDTKPGTIKSQSNSIYRKANVHGRNDLIAFFVEDLLAGENLITASKKPVEKKVIS